MDALRIFAIAREHPLYRNALRGVQRFEDCPVLEKAALYGRILDCMQCPTLRQGVYFSPTGGTTGVRLYFPTAIAENKRQRELLARRLQAAGILRPTSIVLNLFPCTGLLRSLEICNDYCEMCGATVLPVSGHATDEEAWIVADQFGATMVAGTPSRLLLFARWIEAQGRSLSLESVLFSGELLHPQKRLLLERVLGVRCFSGMYGSAETGVVAYQAEVGEPPVYRFPRELIHLEVHNPDEFGFGALIATNLIRIRNPLLRYHTGDVGRVIATRDDEVWVELLGRHSDSFAVGDNYFHLSEFAPVLDQFLQYQIVIRFDDDAGMDCVSFRLVAEEPVVEERQHEVTNAIRKLLAVDRTFTTDAMFVSTEMLLRPSGGMKVPSIVDLRGIGLKR